MAHPSPTNSQPLNIHIIGAGIAGLTCALTLLSQGHVVHIHEQSRLSQETGAAIHLAPNANTILRRFGFRAEDVGAVECKGIIEYGPDGERKYEIELPRGVWAGKWELVHRADLHSALKTMVVEAGGRLKTGRRVLGVDAEGGRVFFADGGVGEGDVVVGGDGVHSDTRAAIPGGRLKAFESGKSAFRFLIPTTVLAADEETRGFVERRDRLSMWIGEDRRVVMYPCSSGTVMNLVGIHPSVESDAGTGWQGTGSKKRMLKIFAGFGEGVAGILGKAEEGAVKVWKLLDMDALPTFVCGRLAVVGDAAHPFLPHQGQGGGQAIEDAAAMAAVLPLGTRAEDVAARLEVYNTCRYTRAHRIQEYTRLAGRDAKELAAEGKTLDMNEYTAYNFGHDEWDASTHALQQHLQSLDPALRYRAPYGFGPTPGPRSPLSLSPTSPSIQSLRNSHPESFTTYTIRFRSSRTFLQNLLPPGFAFTSPSTTVPASIICTALENVTWLGGGGYSHLGLYIHGVHCTKNDDSKVFGTYIPVLFENLADPIITGREEVGFPKLFADIEIEESGSEDCSIGLSWRGTQFGRFHITGLRRVESTATEKSSPPSRPGPGPPPPPPEEGQLVYRYVPTVGQPGKTDAEYAVLCPNPPKDSQKEEERVETKGASLEFQARDWQSLPTLHHVTAKLAQMPVYEVEKAEKVKGIGVGDLSQAVRI